MSRSLTKAGWAAFGVAASWLIHLAAWAAPHPPPEADALVGHWQGSVRFYEVKLHAACGRLPVEVRIEPGGQLSGTLGAAALPPSAPIARKTRIDYQARLEGLPCAQLAPSKTHLVLLVTETVNGGWKGDVHLKSRFGFDLGMHAGEIEMRRVD